MAFQVIPCPGCGEPGGGGTTPAELDATLQRLTGAGSIVIAAGSRSVTLTVLTGEVSTDFGLGTVAVPAGNALSWSVDGPGESFAEGFTFTGVAGSDFLVQSTRE